MQKNAFAVGDRMLYSTLFVLDHFFGRKNVNKPLGGVRKRLQQRMVSSIGKNGRGKKIEVDRVRGLSRDEFFERYAKPGIPVVFDEAGKDWKCCSEWNFKYFRERYGNDDVLIVNHEAVGKNYIQQQPFEHITLGELIEQMDAGGLKYARFHPLLDKHPELQDDFDKAWLRERIYKPITHAFNFHILFIGGKGTSTAIHNAINDNLFLQIEGRKRWTMWPTALMPVFDPEANRAPAKSCDLDIHEPDHHNYPMYMYADHYETVLERGDILYVPPYVWHYVENLTHSIGVGLRWLSLISAFRQSPLLFFLEAFNTNPTMFTTVSMLFKGFDFNKLLAMHKGYDKQIRQDQRKRQSARNVTAWHG